MDLKEKIIEEILFQIEDIAKELKLTTEYRKPLVGMAHADDPLFYQLKEVIASDYLLPEDLLPKAKTVIAYFIPFSSKVIEAHREHKEVAKEWAIAYVETNTLIKRVNERVKANLKKMGIETAYEAPTHYFDKERLISQWSHKHTAFITGLGTFGHHQMLITRAGCGGRIGTLIINRLLPKDPLIEGEFCLREAGKECWFCTESCPVHALGGEELKKEACYQNLLKQDDLFSTLGSTQICGKCCTGPCAMINPVND